MSENTNCISSIKMADGSIYEIKDAELRELLNNFLNGEIIINCGTAPIDDATE